ncbi:hypothetical protein CORC01_05345 [Colletotrichum orchidophilum]|uniref:Uncharacterized protein n=1 Tax=Colletotrichum orchidophilum TaxID=1209926 RepID=A0A1G4BD33_9PEZI|nr:uncharacterized protein CORC01_05345 [Colletotrichum orchidophilum]OHE99304.1 hypothetical protein CORC01_05345 [Colletotrichum orchidophilum]
MLLRRPDEMASRQGAAKTQLARQRGSGDDTRQETGIRTRLCVVRATDAEKVEDAAPGIQDYNRRETGTLETYQVWRARGSSDDDIAAGVRHLRPAIVFGRKFRSLEHMGEVCCNPCLNGLTDFDCAPEVQVEIPSQ